MKIEELYERIKDINLQEGATYAFIGGMFFIIVTSLVGIHPDANIVDAILSGFAATVSSVSLSALTIGNIFSKKREKIKNIIHAEEKREEVKKNTSHYTEVKGKDISLDEYREHYPIEGDLVTLMEYYGIKINDIEGITYLSRVISSLKKALNEDIPNASYWQSYYYDLLATLYEENHAQKLEKKL